MKVLVSACLLGENCKYSGGNNFNQRVVDFVKDKEIIPICPEVMGGLDTPRNPAEIVNGVVMTNAGENVDAQFHAGVQKVLELIEDEDIEFAILQARSPSCGTRQIYDGTFSKSLIDGQGLLAKALCQKGIRLIDSSEFIQ